MEYSLNHQNLDDFTEISKKTCNGSKPRPSVV